MRGLCLLLYLLLVMLPSAPAMLAQDTPETDFARHPLQVFVERDIDSAGTDRLLFVDSLTGDVTEVEVNGERYTPYGRAVLYYERPANRVMLAAPDGSLRPHPFIQPGPQTRRIDWLVDAPYVAWTVTEGPDHESLTTVTAVARLGAAEQRAAFTDGPRNGIRALPVAFSDDHSTLYMDYQPDSIADFTPFRQYAGLFAVDVATQDSRFLPGEPGCFCGAGIEAGFFLRLDLTESLAGFDVVAHNLLAGSQERIPALNLTNYTQAGDVIIAPDGSRAVYALAQIRGFGGAEQSVRTVFVLVDLTTMTQTALTDPITTFVQPVSWTEDNTAIIFTSPDQDGTWKVNLADGRLARIATASYLGTLV